MKRFAKIAAISLAMTTAAAAQPWPGNPPPYERGQYDRGVDEDRARGDFQDGWVPLAEASTAYGPRQALAIEAPAGRFRVLHIAATRGRPFLHRVVLVYGDGSRRNFWIERPLSRRQGVDLQIDGREVRQVLVVAEPDPRAAYTILGF